MAMLGSTVFCSIILILIFAGNALGRGVVQRHILQEKDDSDYGHSHTKQEEVHHHVVYASLEVIVIVLVVTVIVVIVIAGLYCVCCMKGNCNIPGSPFGGNYLCSRRKTESMQTFPNIEDH